MRQALRLEEPQIQSAFDNRSKAIKRRMEVRGIAGGGVMSLMILAIIQLQSVETLRALRIKYPQQKVWAVFEPRTNTTRRGTYSKTNWPMPLPTRNSVGYSQVARLDRITCARRAPESGKVDAGS